jgi:hypothetical protein
MLSLPNRLPTRIAAVGLLAGLLIGGAACQTAAEPDPTPVVQAETDAPTAEPAQVVAEVPPTWTPLPAVALVTITAAPTEPPPATATPLPTATLPPATATTEATPTEEPTATPPPTNTPAPRPTQPPAPAEPVAPAPPPANATLGQNLLPNPSFEEGHWNQDGIPELQLPNGWRLEYEQGATGFGNESWDVYVRPETRVLSTAFLPPEEHGLYIFDGSNTVKIFKGTGAISARLLTDIELQPGTYVLEGNFFSDVFESYSDKRKNPPNNPQAGEAALFAGSSGTGWIGNNYLNRNNLSYTFKVDTAQKIPVGIGFRGRYAIANNGWFVDNLSLRRVE